MVRKIVFIIIGLALIVPSYYVQQEYIKEVEAADYPVNESQEQLAEHVGQMVVLEAKVERAKITKMDISKDLPGYYKPWGSAGQKFQLYYAEVAGGAVPYVAVALSPFYMGDGQLKAGTVYLAADDAATEYAVRQFREKNPELNVPAYAVLADAAKVPLGFVVLIGVGMFIFAAGFCMPRR